MNSKDYWNKREAEALKHRITDEKQYDKKLKAIYSNMLDACQSEINGFFGRYADRNGITIAEAKKRVSKADIAAYERKAKKYVEEKNFTKQANEEMALYNHMMKVNRLEMLKANIGLELLAGHSELEQFMEDILQGRTEDELKRQAGILGKTIKNNAKTANAIVNASFHNATFSDRIWLYQDLLKEDLSKLLQSGLIQGKNPRVLARELEKTFGASQFNAERLMRTELARVQTEAQKQSFIKNGFEMYTFHTNTGCCDICAALDGKHFKIKDMQIGENAAPVHPHCRCSCSAYEDSEEYNEWLDFIANGGTTEEYNKLKQQPKEKQTETKKIETTAELQHYGEQLLSKYGVHIDVTDVKRSIDDVKDNIDWFEKLLSEYKSTVKSLVVQSARQGNEGGGTYYFGTSDSSAIALLPKELRKNNGARDPLNVGEKLYLSTTTHEFAHSITKQENGADESFWKEIKTIRTQYRKALKSIEKAEYVDHTMNAVEAMTAKKQIFISDYANKDLDEFMAEAFTQAKLSETPSKYAEDVLAVVDKHFKRKGSKKE